MNNKLKFSREGNTESVIDITYIKNVDIINSEEFLRNYKISKYFKGKFFLKRLIYKIYKYKFKKKINWDNNFWEKIDVKIVRVSIKYDSYNNNSLQNFLINNISNKRLKDIEKYQALLRNNINLDFPLYICNEALDILSPNLTNEIYMLDGSRRIMAHLLNLDSEINIYLISRKKMLS